MNTERNIQLLKDLLESAKLIKVKHRENTDFQVWQKRVERILAQIYGEDSLEFRQFKDLSFEWNSGFSVGGVDFSKEDRKAFDRDWKILINSLEDYVSSQTVSMRETLEDPGEVQPVYNNSDITSVFISHSSGDTAIVEELVDMLETIGIQSDQIFCTSLSGYGIPLGDNWLEIIKSKLSSNSLVLFVLTENFYKSPICLCEMGATWVLSKHQIPIIVPPFKFSDMKGVFPLSQGFKIDDRLKLNEFKSKIETLMSIDPASNTSSWERRRDRILQRIEQ